MFIIIADGNLILNYSNDYMIKHINSFITYNNYNVVP